MYITVILLYIMCANFAKPSMLFPTPLIEGTLTSRYKRFFADIELPDGTVVTAHCPNTGPMHGVLQTPQRAWIQFHNDPKRKLQYTLEIAERNNILIGCNTHRTNHLARELLGMKDLSPFSHTTIDAEVKISTNSRIDFVLDKESPNPIFVEVKNVTYTDGATTALFPDTVSERAQKHMKELMLLRAQGHRTALVYITQRSDVTAFHPGGGLDPQYAALCEEATRMGVEFYAFACTVSPEEISPKQALPILL